MRGSWSPHFSPSRKRKPSRTYRSPAPAPHKWITAARCCFSTIEAALIRCRASARNVQIKIRSGEFNRVARNHAKIKTVEPARLPVVPSTGLRHRVIEDAVIPRFRKGSIRHLIHADRTRCRPIDFERPHSPRPPPVGSRHGIARPLLLSECRQKLGGNRLGRMSAEYRGVAIPSLGWSLEESAADGEEELRGFSDDLIDPIDRRPQGQHHQEPRDDLHHPRRATEGAHPTTDRAHPTPTA